MSDLKKTVEESFTRYAGNVILDRAICDVRDMLKPSARMLMYSQLHITKNTYNKPFIKSARVVGDCLGHYYTHGDGSCYSTYMRMAKPFAMRYPLEDCQGNCGTITQTGDEAHMRYTELRLSKLGNQLFDSIEKETIRDWYDNFDETDVYPKILPSKGFYNIVNGSTGIGVSLSASIPQFNIKDINEALIKLLYDSNSEIDVLPDFATGGILLNANEVAESLKNGYGSACKIRSLIEFDSKERAFIVKELPYGVYTNTVSEEIKRLVESDPTCGIDNISDGSGKKPDYMIYLSKKANPDKVLKLLLKETSLQSHFTINMNVLTNNGKKPKLMGLKEMLLEHLDHEKEVYRRGYEFDMKKIKARLHIIEGLLKAISAIDEVIKIIKSSTSTIDANKSLQIFLEIDEEQAKAILDIKLARLAKLEINKLQEEKVKLKGQLRAIQEILEDEVKFKTEIEKGLREVAEKYGDARRTKILNIEGEDEEPVEIKVLQLSLTNKNNIYLSETSSLYTQRRGGVGNKMKLDNNEYVYSNITIQSSDNILFFSNKGDFYQYQAAAIPVEEKIPIESIINLKDEEFICTISTYNKSTEKKNILFFTKQGFIKKSLMSEYNTKRSVGIHALTLPEDDEIISVLIMDDERVGILSDDGNFIIVETKDIKPIGRITRGIRGIKLNDGCCAVSAKIIPKDSKYIASVTEDGLIKKTDYSEFNIQGKNTKGSKIQKTDKKMVDFVAINDEKEILIASSSACIKIKIEEIPVLLRGAQGVHSIKMKANDKIVSLSKF